MPRIIPRNVLQIIAILLLLLSVVLAAYWFATDSGLYRLLVTHLGAGRGLGLLLTLLVNLLGVAVVAVVLRAFSKDMPSLRAQLQRDVDLFKAPGTLKEKMESALQQERERRQGDHRAALLSGRVFAVAMMVTGFAIGMVGLASFLMIEGVVFQFQLVLVLLGLGMIVWGIVSLVRSSRSR